MPSRGRSRTGPRAVPCPWCQYQYAGVHGRDRETAPAATCNRQITSFGRISTVLGVSNDLGLV